jgi:hypothetical protein
MRKIIILFIHLLLSWAKDQERKSSVSIAVYKISETVSTKNQESRIFLLPDFIDK